jgi:hypothetical protein
MLFLYGCQNNSKSDYITQPLQKTNLTESPEGLVLTIMGENITSDEIVRASIEQLRPLALSTDYERFKANIKQQLREIITARISNILLYHEAKKNTREDIDQMLERPAEAEIRKYIMDFGGDYEKAEEALKQQGMDWAAFKEYHKKTILIEYYIASLLPKPSPITYSELLVAYNLMKDESFAIQEAIKFQLIDIEPVKLRITDSNQDRLEYARKLADELYKQLKVGKDFLELSNEHPDVSFAAHSQLVQPDSLKYSILADIAEKLKPGDISKPFETALYEHIFIMKLQEKQSRGYEPLERVQGRVKAQIAFDRRRKAQDKILTRFRRQAENELSDEFTEFCLHNIYQMSKE